MQLRSRFGKQLSTAALPTQKKKKDKVKSPVSTTTLPTQNIHKVKSPKYNRSTMRWELDDDSSGEEDAGDDAVVDLAIT